VKILTAGVSLADILIREGIHPESLFKRPPLCIGWDIVGVVDKIGDKASMISTWRIGDTVAALPIVGGYAECLCLPSDQLVPVPYGLDPVEAVSVILNYTTAYQMLHRSAHIESGESVLVHSGGGWSWYSPSPIGKTARTGNVFHLLYRQAKNSIGTRRQTH
jgi:NADPH2:quinone reductase